MTERQICQVQGLSCRRGDARPFPNQWPNHHCGWSIPTGATAVRSPSHDCSPTAGRPDAGGEPHRPPRGEPAGSRQRADVGGHPAGGLAANDRHCLVGAGGTPQPLPLPRPSPADCGRRPRHLSDADHAAPGRPPGSDVDVHQHVDADHHCRPGRVGKPDHHGCARHHHCRRGGVGKPDHHDRHQLHHGATTAVAPDHGGAAHGDGRRPPQDPRRGRLADARPAVRPRARPRPSRRRGHHGTGGTRVRLHGSALGLGRGCPHRLCPVGRRGPAGGHRDDDRGQRIRELCDRGRGAAAGD